MPSPSVPVFFLGYMKKFFISLIIFILCIGILSIACSFRTYALSLFSYNLTPDENDIVFKIKSQNGVLTYNQNQPDVVHFEKTAVMALSYTESNTSRFKTFYHIYCDFNNIDWVYPTNPWISLSFGLDIEGADDDALLYEIQSLNIYYAVSIAGYNWSWVDSSQPSLNGYIDPVNGADTQVELFTNDLGFAYEPDGSSRYGQIRMYKVYGFENIASPDGVPRLMAADKFFVTFDFNGAPSNRILDFFFAVDASVTCKAVDINAGVRQEVSDFQNSAEQVEQGLSVSAPDINNSIGDISDDVVVASSTALLLKPPENNSLMVLLTSVGATSLSICLLGYILFGKKG